jgi:hypothetical protein
MATNESRSLTQSLSEGATDGKYRKARPNTTVGSGTGEEIVAANRNSLHPFYNYGFVNSEEANKVNPAGDTASSRARKYPVFDIEANQMGGSY